MTLDELSRAGTVRSRATRCSSGSSGGIDGAQTSHLKGFSPECCREWTFRDMLRLNDLPHVSQVNGMSLVWAERHRGAKGQSDSTHTKIMIHPINVYRNIDTNIFIITCFA